MKNDKSKNIIIALLIVIIIILSTLVVLLATDKINFKSNKIDVNGGQLNDNIVQENEVNKDNIAIYNGQSFIGFYQLLNYDFMVSKYDSSQNSHIDFEIQLLENGTAKIAYKLDDNGNITTNQYDATYTLESTLTMEIDGDFYKVLKLQYTSSQAANDSIISQISTDITYNPASNPTDGTQSFPKSLIVKGGSGNMIPFMVNANEIKYIK